MSPHAVPSRTLVVVACLALVASGLPVGAGPTTPEAVGAHGGVGTATTGTPDGTATPDPFSDADLVVDGDDDGDDEYATVGAAVDAAEDGDTVAVRPGTYREAVTLDETVALVAPRGATLNGTGTGATAGVTIPGRSDAAPTVEGFTVVGYETGLLASDTDGDWVLRNGTFRGFTSTSVHERVAVNARGSSGDWVVADSTFRDSNDGVDATRSEGDWLVRDSRFLGNGYGVDASFTAGDWVVENSTFRRNRDGVEAWYASGEWVVVDSTFRNNREGVYTSHTDDAWLVDNSTFRNNSIDGVDVSGTAGNWTVRDSVFFANGNALDAIGTSGRWEVHGSIFVGSERSAIIALGTEHDGDATRNWWGNVSGPDRDDCYGGVRCADHLTEPPVDNPAYRGRHDAETWNATPVVTVFETAEPTPTPANRPDYRGPGVAVGTALLALLTVGGVLGPLLYVRRYGLQ